MRLKAGCRRWSPLLEASPELIRAQKPRPRRPGAARWALKGCTGENRRIAGRAPALAHDSRWGGDGGRLATRDALAESAEVAGADWRGADGSAARDRTHGGPRLTKASTLKSGFLDLVGAALAHPPCR